MGLIYLSNFVSIELYVLLPPANEKQFEVGAQILPPPRQPKVQTETKTCQYSISQLSISLRIKDNRKTTPNMSIMSFSPAKNTILENLDNFQFSIFHAPQWKSKQSYHSFQPE